ncbi:MAG: hypothetical protein KGI67_13435 [Pseudomonadota bacterium]|nr:hypothetical protein [Pseudomonadota bacterium]
MVTHSPRPAGAAVWLALALALLLQAAVHRALPPPQASVVPLGAPPALATARLMALGEDAALGRAMMLGLQTYDVQPGVSLPLRSLDYATVVAWLQLVVALDPLSQYALLSAARLYAEIPDAGRSRLMLDFVHQAFLQDPDRRWPWLAHAVVLARHRLQDQQLALFYAHELRVHVTPGAAPPWARQMEALALADLGRNEAARVLLGGLLASGSITEPNERNFLIERLKALESSAEPASAQTSESRH